jgi:hypothetical protein
MPRKKRTFADKMKKDKKVETCPVCNTPVQYIFLVNSVKSDKGSWKFKQKHLPVCKCNHKGIYG